MGRNKIIFRSLAADNGNLRQSATELRVSNRAHLLLLIYEIKCSSHILDILVFTKLHVCPVYGAQRIRTLLPNALSVYLNPIQE